MAGKKSKNKNFCHEDFLKFSVAVVMAERYQQGVINDGQAHNFVLKALQKNLSK